MHEPIRIAQVLNRMDSGGIEMIVMNYYRHINRDGIQFDFYYADDSSFVQKEEMQQLGAGTYPIPSYAKLLQFHRALYRAFIERNYEIAHIHLNTMSVFALFAAWRAGVPVRICHTHSTAHWSEGKVTLLKYVLRPFNKVFANRYFACGRIAGEWMYGRRCMDAGKVMVIPNAINTKSFAYDHEARMRLREELGIAQDAFVVGHVGRFKHQKNHRFMLAVFKEFLSAKPHSVLLLIGEGHKQEEIRKLADEWGIAERVIFTGIRKDIDKLYSVMDVFCLPSYYEGMPIVAWEAQCNGLPCLFSDHITREAMVAKNARSIPLGNIAAWVNEIKNAERIDSLAADEIDIRHHSRILEQLYISEYVRLEDRKKVETQQTRVGL